MNHPKETLKKKDKKKKEKQTSCDSDSPWTWMISCLAGWLLGWLFLFSSVQFLRQRSAMRRTHPNFKTVNPKFSNAESIYRCISRPLLDQRMFKKITTRWDLENWDWLELQKFEIRVEDIDRLYCLYKYNDRLTERYKVIVRMEYNSRSKRNSNSNSNSNNTNHHHQQQPHNHIYVELSAVYDYHEYVRAQQIIFVSRDPNLFMNLTLNDKCQKHLIYQSLAEDGIIIDQKQPDEDNVVAESRNGWERVYRNNPPSLKYFCHWNVYNNEVLNKCYPNVLPRLMSNGVKDFITFQEEKRQYLFFRFWII